jgi:hypothetical protein
MPEMTPTQTTTLAERNYEVMQEAIDMADLRDSEHLQAEIESVTFDELLEAMANWPESRKQSFMHTILNDRKGMAWAQHVFLDCEVHTIANAKMREVA